ncbi:hypothetical protein VTJ83DRAFT_3618 [Remersonia thermophila]|uniref:NmrA-like domain-containing protein n=1 Tax=Remersonia thermophila TaxID=72144 RepID=A0ABR4DGQ3_9PEZI
MSAIKNVAVLGGSGNLGPAILNELVAAGFSVTALTRVENSAAHSFPEGVRVVPVDYSSVDSLKSALAGQDAVVSVLAGAATGSSAQRNAIDAALAVGVKRFIPSEFGINTRNVRGTPIGKILAGKIATVDYLEELAAKNPEFSWTGLTTGLFFDWGLDRFGLGIVNLKEKTSTVVDSGNEKFQASTLAHVGQAVAHILRHPAETANKYIGTASFNLSQNELIALVEELTGQKYPVTTRIPSEELRKKGEEKLEKGDFSAFLELLTVHNNADGAGNALAEEQSANALIGLPYKDLRKEVENWLKRAGAL